MTASASSACHGRHPSKISSVSTSPGSPAATAASTGVSAESAGSASNHLRRKDRRNVSDQNPLGADHCRLPGRPRPDVGGDAICRVEPRLLGAARLALVRCARCADLLSASVLLVVVFL